MSPPIRDGSGSSIGSIRLGDGTEIAEVRTGAGDVLFSGIAIPDSVDYRWPATEGSGSTLSPSIGSVDISMNHSSWDTGAQFNGDTAPDFDGSDDIGTTASQINIGNTQATFGCWLDKTNVAGEFVGIMTQGSDSSILSNGQWNLIFSGNNTDVRLQFGNTSVALATSSKGFNNNQLFVAGAVDGTNGEVWVYDASGTQVGNATGSDSSRNETGNNDMSIMAGNSDNLESTPDDIVVSVSERLSTSEIETIVNNTGPNA